MGENVLEGRGLFILRSPPGGITVQPVGVAGTEWFVNVREDTSLPAGSGGEHSQVRLQVAASAVLSGRRDAVLQVSPGGSAAVSVI